jgi:hypothetical protein
VGCRRPAHEFVLLRTQATPYRATDVLEEFLLALYAAEKENPDQTWFDAGKLDTNPQSRVRKVNRLDREGYIKDVTNDVFPGASTVSRYVRLASKGQKYCESIDSFESGFR